MPSKPACADCIFFRPPGDKDMGLGQCRVKGPDAIPYYDGFYDSAWPPVSPTDWCGKFVRLIVDKPTGVPVLQSFNNYTYLSWEEASRDHAESEESPC